MNLAVGQNGAFDKATQHPPHHNAYRHIARTASFCDPT